MKKYFILPLTAVAFLFTFTACLEVEPDVTFPHVSDFALRSVTPAQPNVNVTEYVGAEVTAVIIEREGYPITSRVVEWTIREGEVSEAQPVLTMTTEGNNVYTATIPGQPEGRMVYWRVVVTQEGADTEESALRTFTWVPPIVAMWYFPHDVTIPLSLDDRPATSGSFLAGTNLAFFYADGARAYTGRDGGDRAPINVPNGSGWLPADAEIGTRFDVNVEESAGWVLTLSTIGHQDITFSAHQSSSNNGARDFRLAYRTGTTGPWTVFGETGVVTAQGDPGPAPFSMNQTFSNVPLPATANNQAVVQVRVWIATNARRSDGTYQLPTGGNTSINNIVFGGNPL